MMMQTVKGIYRDGKVELLEPSKSIAEGKEVIVTYESATSTQETSHVHMAEDLNLSDPKTKMMRPDMFAGNGTSLTREDCKMAEFHGDPDDGLDWS